MMLLFWELGFYNKPFCSFGTDIADAVIKVYICYMKNKWFSLCLVGGLMASLFLVSCAKDEEEPPPSDPRDAFTGSWTCQENSRLNGASSFTLHVNKSSSNSAGLDIENFYNLGFNIKAFPTVSGSSFSASNQPLSNFTIISLSGNKTGTNTFSMNYIIRDGSQYDTCSASCTKQ
jgi:hypothetical protein